MRLSTTAKQYVEESLGCETEEYLYSIQTQTFRNIRYIKSPILKDLHYLNKRGKRNEVRRLRKDEKRILDEKGIKYFPVSYMVYLRKMNI